MFRRLEAEVAAWGEPHQTWLQIDAFDAAQDAVHLHTPNPNGTKFPAEFDGVVGMRPS
ncbi:MAG: hypothetical protein IPK85_03865 [Gemmatimonadetes bacterium]|nr:hypothetical protein [Gemmatimonadota bacterium]